MQFFLFSVIFLIAQKRVAGKKDLLVLAATEAAKTKSTQAAASSFEI